LILRRFLLRRIWPRNRFRAIFYDFKRISKQKQSLGRIFDSIWSVEIAQHVGRIRLAEGVIRRNVNPNWRITLR
jgi:hypothetical protein